MFESTEDVGYFIDQQIKSYMEKYPSCNQDHLIQCTRHIQYEMEQLVREKLSLEGYYYNMTGESPMDVLMGLEHLQNDYLLDAVDDDGYTVPLIQQLNDRLDLLEVEQEENEQLKQKLEKYSCIEEPVKSFESYCNMYNKLKEVEAERDYYKYEYETRIGKN